MNGGGETMRDQIRKGSSELLILSLLAREPMYGYQISQELNRRSGGYFDMKEGLLYPTLHRMQQARLVKSEWRSAGEARRRKYYAITDKGRRVLGEQSAEWRAFIETLLHMLDAAPEAAETS
jgi:PadR family transcriptional regulator PadR